jgi:mannose-6-phosphate isomerase-like protein (cupin superfamily)
MSVRRVVTGVNRSRRSVLVSDGPAPTSWCTEVWATSGDRPQGFDPAEIQSMLMPPPKGTHWRVVDPPPDSAVRRSTPNTVVDQRKTGGTRRIPVDYLMILEGDVTLELDDGKVELHPGDCIVQHATNHRWRNRGIRPARMVAGHFLSQRRGAM